MLRRSTVFKLLTVLLICFVAYGAYSIVFTWKHIPEAYAAWDTGTLLVEYLKSHDDQWPSGWEELVRFVEMRSERPIIFRGAQAGQVDYARSLQDFVGVDWSADPSQIGAEPIVTRLDGGPFPIVWEGAEPNEMIRNYLNRRP